MNTPVLAGILAIAVAVGGSATMNEERAAARVADAANAVASETAGGLLLPSADPDDQPARRKSRCKDCGVVELVARIERPDLVDGVCTVSDDINIRANDLAGDGDPSRFPTLANMTRRAAAAQPNAQSVPTAPRYRIVVRLRNGTRQVFDEATSRTLRSGDLVRVI